MDTGWPQTTVAEIIDRICRDDTGAKFTPANSRAKYDQTLTWFVLGEIVRR